MASPSITLILHDLAGGDKDALNRLMPLVYAELRRLADGYLRGTSERAIRCNRQRWFTRRIFGLIKQEQPGFERAAPTS